MQLLQKLVLRWRHLQSKYLLNKGLVGRDVFVHIAYPHKALIAFYSRLHDYKKGLVGRDVFVNIA